MSTRPQFNPYIVIPNASASPASTASMGATTTSAPTIIQKLSLISYSMSWSAGSTPVGTASIQVSNDFALSPSGAVLTAGTWNTINFNSGGSSVASLAVSGNSGNLYIDAGLVSAYAIRFVYTRSSGSGTMQVIVNAKVT